MTKSYKDLIGIFRGKQAKYNTQILTLLYDNGPLTAWQITGKMTKHGKVSLHATLNKRLRSLEKKGYLQKKERLWFFQFKGIIAALIIQKEPRPISDKWTKLLGEHSKFMNKHSNAFFGATLQINDVTIYPDPVEIVGKSHEVIMNYQDWVFLSSYVKNLMQTGVINLDVISNRTLISVILSQATDEEFENFMKKLKISWKSSQDKKRTVL